MEFKLINLTQLFRFILLTLVLCFFYTNCLGRIEVDEFHEFKIPINMVVKFIHCYSIKFNSENLLMLQRKNENIL